MSALLAATEAHAEGSVSRELRSLNESFPDAEPAWLPTPKASVTMPHRWLGAGNG